MKKSRFSLLKSTLFLFSEKAINKSGAILNFKKQVSNFRLIGI